MSDFLTSEMYAAIEEELHRIINNTFSPQCEELRSMLAYHMGWEGEKAGPEAQGKRIRPLLVLLCTAACRTDWQVALPAAAAVELVHNFSLIHDDIQDNSPLRRGRLTVWKRWGVAQGINAGDAIFSLAQLELLLLARTTSSAIAVEASHLVNRCCIDLTSGQYLDIAYESRQNLTVSDYWPMITGKTARLIATCTRLGGLAGSAFPAQVESFEQFGLSLGLAFQMLDDILGIWGEQELTGKSNESDLITRKKSFPVLLGLSYQKEFAQRWRSGPAQPEAVTEMAHLLENEGARAETLKQADSLTQKALQYLDAATPVKNAAAAELTALTLRLLQRQS
jgi:geranylgeranyl diphosphate synthase type I